MLTILLSLTGLIGLTGTAEAGSWSVGVGGGVVNDLADAQSTPATRFGPGGSLMIPVAWEASERVAIRAVGRVDMASGRDVLSWSPGDAGVRFVDDRQVATHLGAGLSVGPELRLPLNDRFGLALGAGIGLGWVATYHKLQGDTYAALVPEGQESGLQPHTRQFVKSGEAHGGADMRLSDGMAIWAEVGYSSSFIGAQPLRAAAQEAQREAYLWNVVRGGLGVRFSL